MLVSPTINSVHGRVFWHTGTDPAAGAQIQETVPDRRRWKILGIRFTFVTNATVQDRRVALIIDDGATAIYLAEPASVQAASLNLTYNYSNVGVAPFLLSIHHVIPLSPLILPAGSRIRTLVIDIQAGDNLGTPLFLIEEWIDP